MAKLACLIVLLTIGLLAARYANAGQSGSEAPAVHVGGNVKPPLKVKDAKPVYPEIARQSRTQGVVILEITIGTDGKVKAVKALKSITLLEAAAVDAAKKWEFKPTIIDGKPTAVIMPVAVNFTLD